MARWSDVFEAQRREREAVKACASAMADAEMMRGFLRETGQADAFMEWYAKKIGVWESLYADDSVQQTGDRS